MTIDLSALDRFSINDLTLEVKPTGQPLALPLADVMEDPNQPRQSFSADALQELADSIRERGVKSPISVRPIEGGKYLINHGARRYRASLLAGKDTIPAFVDDAHDDYDKAIENIQREDLTPLEIAQFISRRVAAGDKKGDIARRLGKPGSFVSEHAALLEAPPCIRSLCASGRCTDVKTLYALIRAYQDFPAQVAAFVDGAETISRSDLNRLAQWLKHERQPAAATAADDPDWAASAEETGLRTMPDSRPPEPTVTQPLEPDAVEPLRAPATPQQPQLVVRHGGRRAYLVLPSEVEIRYQDSGEEARVAADTLEWLSVSRD